MRIRSRFTSLSSTTSRFKSLTPPPAALSGWRTASTSASLPASTATVQWKVLPSPGRLSTHRRPPIISASWRLMLNPRPVPP